MLRSASLWTTKAFEHNPGDPASFLCPRLLISYRLLVPLNIPTYIIFSLDPCVIPGDRTLKVAVPVDIPCQLLAFDVQLQTLSLVQFKRGLLGTRTGGTHIQ